MVRIAASLVLLTSLCGAAEWQSLFDGKALGSWKVVEGFRDHGPVRVEDSAIVLVNGHPFTGIAYTGSGFPKNNYEIRFQAKKIRGGDFFASLTFPFGDSWGTLVTGGWGGDIVGISSVDGWDASENETRTYVTFEDDRWYAFRLRVTPERIEAFIDDKPVVDLAVNGRQIGLRPGATELTKPLGFFSYNTAGAIRAVEYRIVPAASR